MGKNKSWVLGILLFVWLCLRLIQFTTFTNSPLYHLYQWKESDSAFFDDWAQHIAEGDWANQTAMHPFHNWHKSIADQYFKTHPDALNRIHAAYPNRDSTFDAGRIIWREWYGGNRYHQEPFYTYLLAIIHTVSGNGVYWLLFLQIITGLGNGILIWTLARRYFDDTVALVTGVLYALCGIVLFQEILLLRTTWIVFFTLFTVWTFQQSLDKKTQSSYFLCGCSLGLAFLLQSTFILYFAGILILIMCKREKEVAFLPKMGILTGGFLLMILPLLLRNLYVGSPLLSSSSIGAITFAATNHKNTKAVSNWQPNPEKCAEIMAVSGGSFGRAVIESLKTQSIGSYFGLLYSKAKAMLNGTEWPNNENYYFYKEQIPVLKWTFIDFFWIGFLGISGIILAIYQKKKNTPLYLAIFVQIAIMLGFYVLGRLRLPLAVLLLPFAAFCIVSCFRVRKSQVNQAFFKIAVVVTCYFLFAYPFGNQSREIHDFSDYDAVYDLVYLNKVKQNAESGNYKAAIAAHDDFLKCQPEFIKKIRPGVLISNANKNELLNYFANHYQIHSFLYEDSGDKTKAIQYMNQYNMMKQVVENSKREILRKASENKRY